MLETATTVINKSARKAFKDDLRDDEMREDDEDEGKGKGPTVKAEVKRPKSGELKWWINNVDPAPATKKNARYNWGTVGSESACSQLLPISHILTRTCSRRQ